HHDGAARVRKQLASQSDQAAAGHTEIDAHASIAMVVHVAHFTFTYPQLFHDYSNEFLGNIDSQFLHRLHEPAIDFLGNTVGFTSLSTDAASRGLFQGTL